ncbi:hypothetical protein [Nostoc sp.]
MPDHLMPKSFSDRFGRTVAFDSALCPPQVGGTQALPDQDICRVEEDNLCLPKMRIEVQDAIPAEVSGEDIKYPLISDDWKLERALVLRKLRLKIKWRVIGRI